MNVTLYRGFRFHRVLLVVGPIAVYEFSRLHYGPHGAEWSLWFDGGVTHAYYLAKARFALCLAIPLLLVKLAMDLHTRFIRRAKLVFNRSMVIDEYSSLSLGAIPWSDIESMSIRRTWINSWVDIRIKPGDGRDATHLLIGGLGISASQEQGILGMSPKVSPDRSGQPA